MAMIRDNHRHASINTTQIYMHSEDVARHSIMRDHSIDIAFVNIEHETQYYLSIKLAKGPLDKRGAVSLIRKSIETNLLKNAHPIDDANSDLKYKLVAEASDAVIDSIKMLCRVWMFDPTIEQGLLCTS